MYFHIANYQNKKEKELLFFEGKNNKKMSSFRPPLGDPDLLKKRPSSNPRYNRVEAVVDSGASSTMQTLLKQTEVSIKPQRDELFRRLRPLTIAIYLEEKLMVQKQRELDLLFPNPNPDHSLELLEEHKEWLQSDPHPPIDPRRNINKSTCSSVPRLHAPPLHGKNEKENVSSLLVPPPTLMTPVVVVKRKYLLLDVREKEDYEKGHIHTALHFPPTKLNHATNPYTAEILNFRNKEHHAILLYDLDEEIVVQRKVGNIFFEKGCDNVFVLSGGLRVFVQDFMHLMDGVSPVPVIEKSSRVTSRLGGRQSIAGSQRCGGADGNLSVMAPTSTASSHKPKPLASSLARPPMRSGGSWK